MGDLKYYLRLTIFTLFFTFMFFFMVVIITSHNEYRVVEGNVDDVTMEEHYMIVYINDEKIYVDYPDMVDNNFFNLKNESELKIRFSRKISFFNIFTDWVSWEIDTIVKI